MRPVAVCEACPVNQHSRHPALELRAPDVGIPVDDAVALASRPRQCAMTCYQSEAPTLRGFFSIVQSWI
jgi:hypothetical protein